MNREEIINGMEQLKLKIKQVQDRIEIFEDDLEELEDMLKNNMKLILLKES